MSQLGAVEDFADESHRHSAIAFSLWFSRDVVCSEAQITTPSCLFLTLCRTRRALPCSPGSGAGTRGTCLPRVQNEPSALLRSGAVHQQSVLYQRPRGAEVCGPERDHQLIGDLDSRELTCGKADTDLSCSEGEEDITERRREGRSASVTMSHMCKVRIRGICGSNRFFIWHTTDPSVDPLLTRSVITSAPMTNHHRRAR